MKTTKARIDVVAKVMADQRSRQYIRSPSAEELAKEILDAVDQFDAGATDEDSPFLSS